MAAVVWQPSPATPSDTLEVRAAAARIYSFEPGVPLHVDPWDQATVLTAVRATASALVSPALTSVTPTGGAAGSYTYEIVASNGNGDSVPGATTNITTGPTTLDGTHYNTLVWPAVTGARNIKVIRTVGGSTQGLIATLPGTATSYVDNTPTGATSYTPSGSNVSQAAAILINDTEI